MKVYVVMFSIWDGFDGESEWIEKIFKNPEDAIVFVNSLYDECDLCEKNRMLCMANTVYSRNIIYRSNDTTVYVQEFTLE